MRGVPTRLIASEFLAVLRIVDQVNEDIWCVLVWLDAWLWRFLFLFHKCCDLFIVHHTDLSLSGIVHIFVDIGRIEASILLIVILSMMWICWPDLLDICLTKFGNLLLASRWGGHYLMCSFLLAARDKVLAVGAHSEGAFLRRWVNYIVLHRTG